MPGVRGEEGRSILQGTSRNKERILGSDLPRGLRSWGRFPGGRESCNELRKLEVPGGEGEWDLGQPDQAPASGETMGRKRVCLEGERGMGTAQGWKCNSLSLASFQKTVQSTRENTFEKTEL